MRVKVTEKGMSIEVGELSIGDTFFDRTKDTYFIVVDGDDLNDVDDNAGLLVSVVSLESGWFSLVERNLLVEPVNAYLGVER